jgi:hypothetical protein
MFDNQSKTFNLLQPPEAHEPLLLQPAGVPEDDFVEQLVQLIFFDLGCLGHWNINKLTQPEG